MNASFNLHHVTKITVQPMTVIGSTVWRNITLTTPDGDMDITAFADDNVQLPVTIAGDDPVEIP